jgi:hypothetical protein
MSATTSAARGRAARPPFLALQPSDENGEQQLKGPDINHGPESLSRCDGFVVC